MTAGRVKSADVVEYRDIDYVAGRDYGNGYGKLDVFMPADATKVPVVVYFHGGALMSGTKAIGHGLARQLARRRIGVVCAGYRLSPAVRHPAHIQDAAMAFAWTKRNIGKYDGDFSRVFLAGHSSGGYLSVMLSLDPSYLSVHGMRPADIRGTILISAFLYVEEPEVAPNRPRMVWGNDKEVWRAASVAPYIDAGKPPMLFLCADGDEPWRREQNKRLKEDLILHGNSVEMATISDRTHSGINASLGDDNDVAMTAIENFVKRH